MELITMLTSLRQETGSSLLYSETLIQRTTKLDDLVCVFRVVFFFILTFINIEPELIGNTNINFLVLTV